MPVITNPNFALLSSKRPITYQTFFTETLPSTVDHVLVDVVINGITEFSFLQYPSSVVPSFMFPGTQEYYFEIDVHDYLDEFLAPLRARSSMFLDLGTGAPIIDADAFVSLQCRFSYYRKNGTTGLIELIPGAELSSINDVSIAIPQNGDSMNLEDEFVGLPFVTGAKRFLTNSPNTQTTCIDTGNHYLSFLSNWNWCKIETFDAAGALLSTAYFPTNGTTSQQTTIGVGPANLAAITTWLNGVAPVFAGASSYSIEAGLGVPIFGGLIFFINSSTRILQLEDCCEKKLKLYWLNSLGGVDTFQFASISTEQTTTADVAEKPLNWTIGSSTPHNQDDFGLFAFNIQAKRKYNINTRVPNSLMAWVKELFASPEVYIENPNDSSEYWRIYTTPGTVVERQSKGIVELQFEINLSQNPITHQL